MIGGPVIKVRVVSRRTGKGVVVRVPLVLLAIMLTLSILAVLR